MNPKKANKLYKSFSEENSYNEDLVENVVDFYYKHLRKLLTNLEYPRLNVDGLGQIVAKPMIVNKSISKLKNFLNNHDTSTFKAYHNKKAIELKLANLIKLEKKILDQKEKKNLFYNTKNNEERT
jgi:hypothetical protein